MKKKVKKILINFSVSILSLVFVLMVLEGILRMATEFKFRPKGVARLPISRTYRLSDNKHLVYELLPDSKARIESKEFRINAFGFRDKDYRVRKANKTRIIFIGDSITYGWSVSLEHTYHKRLENLLNQKGYDVDILGMGVPGYNTVQEYHLIKDKALVFDPDLIVLQIAVNDFERTVGLKKYEKGKQLILIPYHDFSIPFVFKKTPFTYFLMQHSFLFKQINLKLYWLKNKRNPDYLPKNMFFLGEEKSFQYLKKIKDLADKRAIPLAAVIFPFEKRGHVYAYASLHEKIHSTLDNMSVPHVDLFEALNSNTNKDTWIERRHPNEQGHEIASLVLFRFLEPIIKNQ
jgi:lysophospholipase L1-like esterase